MQDAESQVHGKIDRFWSMLFDPSVVWVTLNDLTWGQVDQDGLDAASDDMLERVVRIMHTQGVRLCAEGGLGTGRVEHGCNRIRSAGLDWTV